MVIKLNKFKISQEVEIDDTIYTVRGLTVGDFINNDISDKLEKASNTKEQCKIMIAAIGELSDIPESVLLNLDFASLHTLIQVSQGAYKEDGEEEVVKEGGKKRK